MRNPCHAFRMGAAGHSRHLGYVAERASALDPARADAGEPLCVYCHAGDDGPTERSRAVCHHRHLRGHQPPDQAGRAHLWTDAP